MSTITPPSPASFRLHQHPNFWVYALLMIPVVFGSFLLVTWLCHVLIGNVVASIVFLPFVLIYAISLFQEAMTAIVEATATETGLVLKVTKPGFKIPKGQTVHPWSDLYYYRWQPHPRQPSTLYLKWSFQKITYYNKFDSKEFYIYLQTHFPKREWTAWGHPLYSEPQRKEDG